MKRWLRLIVLTTAVWAFILIIPRILGKIEVYHQFMESSRSKGIDNSALFYSEEPHALESERILKEKLKSKKKIVF